MRLRAIIPSLLVIVGAVAADQAPEPIDLTGGQPVANPPADDPALTEKASYIFGWQIAQQIKQLELDPAKVQAALADQAAGKPSVIAEAEFQQVIMAFQQMMQAKQAATHAKEGAERKQTNAVWLADNAKKDGVKATASGLQYSVIKSGTGAAPTKADQVMVNYTGKLTDGTVFDSSERNGGPVTFGVGQVIRGWTEALQLMKEGDQWTLYIPSELAYGEQAPPNIGPNQILVFDVELVKVVGAGGAGGGLDVAPVQKDAP